MTILVMADCKTPGCLETHIAEARTDPADDWPLATWILCSKCSHDYVYTDQEFWFVERDAEISEP